MGAAEVRANRLVIQTPEGIEFPLTLAGPVSRCMAVLLDSFLVATASTVVGMFINAFRVVSADIASALGILSFFLMSTGYPILTEYLWRGQTIGKRVFRLRVMDAEGFRVRFSQILIRNLLRYVDFLPAFYCTGGIFCLLSRHAQRLGDIAAGTIVVRDPRIEEPDLSQLFAAKYNSFREYPHLIARVRKRISVPEAGILLQALVRRENLNPAARLELFRKFASHLRTVVEFPQEAVEGLTDEQYVRNIVEILFRAPSSERIPS